MITGIYRISSAINGKIYIGQSKDIHKRWQRHRRDLTTDKHISPILQAAWTKYGASEFSFEIVERCSKEELDDRETYWIQHYDSLNCKKGYNITWPKDNKYIGDQTNLKKKVYNKTGRGESIIAISKEGDVSEWRSTALFCTSKGLNSKKIAKVVKYWKDPNISQPGSVKSYKGFIVVKKSLYNPDFNYLEHTRNTTEIRKANATKPGQITYNSKQITFFNEAETIVFNSLREAALHFKMNRMTIKKALDSGKDLKGFKIKFG